MNYTCIYCDYNTSRIGDLNKHNKTVKHRNKELINSIKILDNKKNFICNICNKKLSSAQRLEHHTQRCRGVSSSLECSKCNKLFNKSNTRYIHEKKCGTSQNKILDNNIKHAEIIEDKSITQLVSSNSLILNNIIITSREKDNYINATLLCKAGNKKFNKWYSLCSTKNIIALFKKKSVIEKNLKEIWIHPVLAIELSKWISNDFTLLVIEWTKSLDNKNNIVSIDKNLLEEKDLKIKLLEEKDMQTKLLDNNGNTMSIDKKLLEEKDMRIKLLEKTYLKKQKRQDYKEQNVIYMLSTVDYKERRIYIIGKAQNLKFRLSTYNKTIDHEVIYYKECKDENTMNIVEKIILSKLNNFREVANRDRFILPIEKDITYFIKIIDDCVLFCNN